MEGQDVYVTLLRSGPEECESSMLRFHFRYYFAEVILVQFINLHPLPSDSKLGFSVHMLEMKMTTAILIEFTKIKKILF